MKVRFETGARYAVKIRLPSLIQPKVAIAMLKGQLADVVIGGVSRGVTTLEARWIGKPQVFDSTFLLDVHKLS